MPVGDNKSNDDFARINQPLLAIDELWNRFTKKMGGRIIYNYHGPERRSFIRNPDGFERTVFLAGVNDAKDANGNAIGLIYVLGLLRLLIVIAIGHFGPKRSPHCLLIK